ncbi:MAG: SurA N-terminal domain-containing protein [Pseudomonadales bacterium]|nr:SurA N-terminal domain-containing protein [Pseudomonadales bacterium]
MLQTIRDNSQGLIAKLIIGFIIGLMALFGVESIVGGLSNNATVAEVNGEDITEPELAATVQQLLLSVGGDIGNLDEGLLRQIALNQLIEDRVLRQNANQSHMTISSDAVDRLMINNPQFQVGGVFNSELAIRTMATQGYSIQGYRESLADQMVVGQLMNAYAATSFATEAELNRVAALSSQKRDFRFVSVTLGNRTLGEAIPADQIEAYYQNNQSQFMLDEEVGIDYVVLDKNAIFDEVSVDDAAVQAQYELEASAAVASSQRRASHILLETGAGLSEEEAITMATALKARLDQGEDFAALALEASADTASAEQGGDIGYTDGSAFPTAVEEALDTLQVGEVSDPVVSEFGVHLVKLTENEQNEYPPLAEVEERIRRELSTSQVDSLYFSRLEDLANLAFETTGLQDISGELGLEIVESEMFSRLGGSNDITSNANVISAAFADDTLIDGNNSDVIELGDSRAVVLHVREHSEPSLRPLEEVRGEIAAILRTEMEKERASALGQSLLSSLRNGEDITGTLADNELQWIAQNGASRDQAGMNGEVLQNAFAMPAPAEGETAFNGFVLTNGTYVVLELQAVQRGSLADLSADERRNMINTFIERDGRATVDAFVANSRLNADITQNLSEEPLL